MANSQRVARVSELIRMELSNIILKEMKDPRIGFVTITAVEVAPDLRDAKVMVSVMGSNKEKKSAMIALDHSKGFLQHRINDVIRLKFTPRLHFKLDASLEESMKIDKILSHIRKEKRNRENKEEDSEQ